jgi:hypothetical protein
LEILATQTGSAGPELTETTKALHGFFAAKPEERITVAQNSIERLVKKDGVWNLDDVISFAVACDVACHSLEGYATLDSKHVKNIREAIQTVGDYLKDDTLKRPLSFMLLASPGSGKSHLVKCIVQEVGKDNVEAIQYNMAATTTALDILAPLDEARNVKVQDKIPLIFLDEYDSRPEIAFSLLLPLLWDGAISLGPRTLRLGKCIFILAGSDPALATEVIALREKGGTPRGDMSKHPKFQDLLSRINGSVLEIPPLDGRRVDKIPIAIALLKQRHGADIRSVPLCLLRFIYECRFAYDSRSIAALIDALPRPRSGECVTHDDLKQSVLTSRESFTRKGLDLHLITDEGHPCELWTMRAVQRENAILLPNRFCYRLNAADLDEAAVGLFALSLRKLVAGVNYSSPDAGH